MSEFWPNIHWWRAVAEILILWGIIYFLLRFLRGTRGAAVLTGLAVLLISLTLVTRLLELDTISWLLSWFFGFFAIAVLVIFQPEFRRVLAELGSRQFFATSGRGLEVINNIVTAAMALSAKRQGALIAIENSIGFRGVIESGVEMDCKVNPEILTTIFTPNTPLHDGGVVIRGDRVLAAACIFPLTDQRGLDLALGTRHRAAIGLSEETDAVIIVVSEETGSVSVAHRGVLHRDLNREMLQRTLELLLLRSQTASSRWIAVLRRWLGFSDFGSSSPHSTDKETAAPSVLDAKMPETAHESAKKTS